MDKKKFDELCEKLHFETHYDSSGGLNHPIFKELVGAGHSILPWLLNKVLWDDRWHWFALVRAITGEMIWPAQYNGYVPIMVAYTIVWGVNNGIINPLNISRSDNKRDLTESEREELERLRKRKKPGPKPKKEE